MWQAPEAVEETERPRLEEFVARVGGSFHAHAHDGRSAGLWRLERCVELPKPDLPSLADADCFTLEFSTDGTGNQGIYRLQADDGFTAELFAVPSAPGRMFVTIN